VLDDEHLVVQTMEAVARLMLGRKP
jgi:hypothetical protein